jgi:hypothetical protein
MRPEERLAMIAELLAAPPTRTGIFGREVAAAHALASTGELETVVRLLEEARFVGSGAADSCLLLQSNNPRRTHDPFANDHAGRELRRPAADHGGFELWSESDDAA